MFLQLLRLSYAKGALSAAGTPTEILNHLRLTYNDGLELSITLL